jgi:hypothetical protein
MGEAGETPEGAGEREEEGQEGPEEGKEGEETGTEETSWRFLFQLAWSQSLAVDFHLCLHAELAVDQQQP